MGYGTTWGSSWGSGGGVASLVGSTSDFGPFLAAIARGHGGRIQPENWTTPDADYVMCLGSDVPGHFGKFNHEDRIDVSQEVDFETGLIVRCSARIRGPSAMPSGASWWARLLLDGVEFARRKIEAGRTRDLSDMGANLTHLNPGTHVLTFRLQLQGSPAAGPYLAEMPAFYLDSISVDLP